MKSGPYHIKIFLNVFEMPCDIFIIHYPTQEQKSRTILY